MSEVQNDGVQVTKVVKVSQIVEGAVKLRDVDRNSDKYQRLLASIKKHGIIDAPAVTELGVNQNTGQMEYSAINGAHRIAVARDLGWAEITVSVRSGLNASEQLEMSITANLNTIDTKPFEYARALVHYCTEHPEMTKAQLCNRVACSEEWLDARLRLASLPEAIGALIDNGTIKVSNAIKLAQLPAEEVESWVEDAGAMPADEFAQKVATRKRELRSQSLADSTKPKAFVPTPRFRQMSEIRNELDSPVGLSAAVEAANPKDKLEAAKVGLQFAIKLDKPTLKAAESAWKASEKDRIEKQKKRREERKGKLSEKAKELRALADRTEQEAKALGVK